VAPISRAQQDHALEVSDAFDRAGLRAVIYDGNETIARRIVAGHEAGAPLMAIVGQREVRSRSIALRERDGSKRTMSLKDAVTTLSSRR
jgi:threonyl-tRNA synthetase